MEFLDVGNLRVFLLLLLLLLLISRGVGAIQKGNTSAIYLYDIERDTGFYVFTLILLFINFNL